MRGVKIGLIVFAACLFALALGGLASAFHSGGVAECVGCHSMHSPAPGGTSLLVGTDPSSACLTCHEQAGLVTPSSYHVSTADADMPVGVPPSQMTPGGDFGWLKKSYAWVPRSGAAQETEAGASHGHNIIATDKGYNVDPVNATAPGGTFQSTRLSCTSCHDPHGRYRRNQAGAIATTGQPIYASGSYYNGTNVAVNEPTATESVGVYRLLAGAGYQQGVISIPYPGVPAAKVPSTYNRTEASTQTRTAYGVPTTSGHATWGNWCGTCHSGMHTTGGNYVHPVDRDLGSTVKANYDAYVKTGDMTGSNATAFSSLVPFATNTNSYTALAGLAVNNNTQLAGPTTTDQVTCLSCHRAHASGWPYALRFNVEGEFMTYNSLYPGTDTTPTVPQFARGRLGAETQRAYYERPVTQFASYQRVLCNKCHQKD